jgi:hypothetical protein
MRRRLAHDFPRHITATPIDRSRPYRKASSVGLAATDLASSQPGLHRHEHGTKRWQFAVGAFALATSAMLFWISHVGDQAAAAATTMPAASTLQITPLAHPPAPSANTLAVADPVANRVADPATPSANPELRNGAEPDAAAEPTAARAPGARRTPPVTSAPSARAPSHRSTVSPRPATARSAPVVPRRGDKVDPDGTFDVYR